MSRAEDLLGTQLGDRFRLDSVVNETTDLFVFAGTDSKATNQPGVTIRVVRPLRGSSDDELRDAFDRFAVEAEQLSQISKASPEHVEQLLASGEAVVERERFAYCVFARTDGSSLAQLRGRGGAQSLARVITALAPIAKALSIAHEQGAFHGDVRPENLILFEASARPTIKVIRFTLATRLGGSNSRTFSPAYGAPEHFKRTYGDSSVGAATDVYGLALCIIELVTGRPPFDGSHQSEFYKQTTDISRRPTLRTRGATENVSPAVDAVIARAVAVNPKLRFPNAAEFWSALTLAAGPIEESQPGLTDEAADALAAAASSTVVPASGSNPSYPSIPGGALSSNTERQAEPASSQPEPPEPIRRLDEGLPDSIPPQRPLPRLLIAGVLGGGLAALLIGVLLIVVSSKRSGGIQEKPIVAKEASVIVATTGSAEPPVLHPSPEGMVLIAPGTFTMGKDTEGKGDRPAHKVKITKPYFLDLHEVTVEAYSACIDAGACERRTLHVGKKIQGGWGCNLEKAYANHPANCLDRTMAAAYCAFVKKRLPTEAEWEYAARSSDERDFPWGVAAPTKCSEGVISGVAGACGERKGTYPIGSAPEGKSPFGLQDMAGNVWEWVADDYAPYPEDEVTDPMVTLAAEGTAAAAAGAGRGILRGGSWDYGAQAARTTYRLPFVSEAGNGSIGVRCARNALATN